MQFTVHIEVLFVFIQYTVEGRKLFMGKIIHFVLFDHVTHFEKELFL